VVIMDGNDDDDEGAILMRGLGRCGTSGASGQGTGRGPAPWGAVVVAADGEEDEDGRDRPATKSCTERRSCAAEFSKFHHSDFSFSEAPCV
jgi:hypothetical protein